MALGGRRSCPLLQLVKALIHTVQGVPRRPQESRSYCRHPGSKSRSALTLAQRRASSQSQANAPPERFPLLPGRDRLQTHRVQASSSIGAADSRCLFPRTRAPTRSVRPVALHRMRRRNSHTDEGTSSIAAPNVEVRGSRSAAEGTKSAAFGCAARLPC